VPSRQRVLIGRSAVVLSSQGGHWWSLCQARRALAKDPPRPFLWCLTDLTVLFRSIFAWPPRLVPTPRLFQDSSKTLPRLWAYIMVAHLRITSCHIGTCYVSIWNSRGPRVRGEGRQHVCGAHHSPHLHSPRCREHIKDILYPQHSEFGIIIDSSTRTCHRAPNRQDACTPTHLCLCHWNAVCYAGCVQQRSQ
jgi:hypothetical protein